MQRSNSYLLGFAFLVLACGPDEARDQITPERTLPFPVVFEVDFLDVYGPIEVEIEGGGTIRIDESVEASCEHPLFVAEEGKLSFRAMSSRHFFWQGEVEGPTDGSCLTIPLDAENIESGILQIAYKHFRSSCFPVDVFLAVDEGPEVLIGTMRHSGSLIEYQVPPVPGKRERMIFQAVREGRLVAVGGGDGRAESYWYRMSGPCGEKERSRVAPPPPGGMSGVEFGVGS